ncbi:MAG: glutamine-hydrolyzing carbamoyl-phosphate synthase small subunit [Gammaproteobacteria bacterium]
MTLQSRAKPKPALLMLANGACFHGLALGAEGTTVGEVVFNTAMTGYQEMLTDPSYAQQIITLTYPHIGNVGINSEDNEANTLWAKGLVVRDVSLYASSWRYQKTLQDYLSEQGVVGISAIDTRRLTRILQKEGAMNGCIQSGDDINEEQALAQAQGAPSLAHCDLAKVVSTKKMYQWNEGSWNLQQGYSVPAIHTLPYHVVVYDFGVKHNILRLLVDAGCTLTVVPAQTPADTVLAMAPDGVVLSNGPGDPAACDYAIEAVKQLMAADMPLLGICLGHQLLALAAGARTRKMKLGHHGANHPIQAQQTKRVMITSQNHGFVVDETTLPASLQITHRSLFDDTIQGIRVKDKPFFSFQGHPESSPGPHDNLSVFEDFVRTMVTYKLAKDEILEN